MPAKSQAQRALLAAKFGPEWMHEHHYDNPGRLPAHVKKGKRMAQSDRDKKVAQFVKGKPPRFPSPHGQATTKPGKLSGGDRITEDDPRWKPKSSNVGPTGDPRRPYQQFVGVGGKQASAPAGSGPLNPVRPKNRYYLGRGAAKYKKGSGRPD
jgi:hypothetical protein